MISVVPLIFKIGPWLLAAAGVVFGLFRHQRAKVDSAAADKMVAEASAQVAQLQTAEAQASATAMQAGSDAAAARTGINNDLTGMSAEEVRDELQAWTRRN
ncbi:hypothetical protein [Burkholderia sp. JKS000303]|uniref:hypothetical protein n=1 Tax=Burkholderia sp. JKS000303 TaxID=1938747 RepID=UPI00117D0A79|nr:hypothetical protein [Burkholderia sp. JKS000303]